MYACSQTAQQSNILTAAPSKVSIEIRPNIKTVGKSRSLVSQCLTQQQALVSSQFSKTYYSIFSTLVRRSGMPIVGMGEAHQDIVVDLNIIIYLAKHSINSQVQSSLIDYSGNAVKATRMKGTAIKFDNMTLTSEDFCRRELENKLSNINQAIYRCAQELAVDTFYEMVEKGLL